MNPRIPTFGRLLFEEEPTPEDVRKAERAFSEKYGRAAATSEDAEVVYHLAKVIRAGKWYEANKSREDLSDEDREFVARLRSIQERSKGKSR